MAGKELNRKYKDRLGNERNLMEIIKG